MRDGLLTFPGVFELSLQLRPGPAEHVTGHGTDVGSPLVGLHHHGGGSQLTQPALPAGSTDSRGKNGYFTRGISGVNGGILTYICLVIC